MTSEVHQAYFPKSDVFPCPNCICLAVCKPCIKKTMSLSDIERIANKCSLLRNFIYSDYKKRLISHHRAYATFKYLNVGVIENGLIYNALH